MDPLIGKLFLVELGVGGAGRVDDQGLHISHIGQQEEDGQIVEKISGLCGCPLDLFLIKSVAGFPGQRWMVNRLYLGMSGQVIHNLKGIAYMPLHTR